MEQHVPSEFIPMIKGVVQELVVGNYSGLIADGRAEGWTVDLLHGYHPTKPWRRVGADTHGSHEAC